MNSNNDVDMAAAVIICSVEARAASGSRGPLGLPARRHRLPRARLRLQPGHVRRTPAIELGGRRALELAGLGIDDVAIVDLYSCFPSAVQLGASPSACRPTAS